MICARRTWRPAAAVLVLVLLQLSALPIVASAEDVAAPTSGYLKWLLNSGDAQYASWVAKAQNLALYLFGPLVMIQAVLGPGKAALREGREEALVTTLDFVLRKGFWLTVITQADVICPAIVDTLAYFGQSLGGEAKTAPAFYGGVSSSLLMNTAADAFHLSWTGIDGDQLIVGIAACCMSFLALCVSWTIGLTLAASKIITVGGLPLVGLTGLDQTSRFGVRYLEALLRLGIRLMVLSIIVVLAKQFTSSWAQLSEGPTIDLLLTSIADCFGILLSLLVFPSTAAAIATGAVGDSGEGKIAGFAGGMAMTAASMGVAAGMGFGMSKAAGLASKIASKLTGGGGGGAGGSGAERAARVMAAAGTRASSGGNSGGGGGGGGGGGEGGSGPSKPKPARPGRVKRAVDAGKKLGRAGANGLGRGGAGQDDGDDGDE